MKLLFTIWVFLQALIAAPLAYSDQARHNHSSIIQKRPVEDPDRSTRPWWDFWGAREKVIDSYQDTITWEVDFVFGKKATDNLGHALLKFFFSPEGKRFVFQNRNSFLVNKLEDTDQFEKAFWEDFEAWLKKNGNETFFDEKLVKVVNLIGVLAKKLVQQGVEKSGLDMKVELDVVPWEKTAGFKANPTFPIRSYFYAANAKKAIVPYQVTEFLDSLDTYNFNKEVRQALK